MYDSNKASTGFFSISRRNNKIVRKERLEIIDKVISGKSSVLKTYNFVVVD